jgi:glycosyltransferase involved in cell wall biosynthesis
MPNLPGVEVHVKPGVEELANLYSSAWILCSTSAYEGFGVPIIEAWASGTAVLSTPHQGAKELIEDGSNGVLAGPDQYGQALNNLILESGLRRRVIESGRITAAAFTTDSVARQYEKIYDELARK